MYTDDNGIVRFESLDNIAPLQVGLNAAMESISGALDSNVRIWPVANQSAMNALLVERGASPLEPLYVHRADTGNLERNTGNGWEIYPKPVEDTGWVNLSYASGYSSASTGQLRARMIGGQVHLLGGATGTYPRNSYTRINSTPLPVEMRPSADIFVAAVGSAGRAATARITISGYIEPNHFWDAAPGWMSVAGITYDVT